MKYKFNLKLYIYAVKKYFLNTKQFEYQLIVDVPFLFTTFHVLLLYSTLLYDHFCILF